MTTNEEADVPPTEPQIAVAIPKRRGRPPGSGKNRDTGTPAVARPITGPLAMTGAKTRLSGSTLVPDLDKHRGSVDRAYWYWIGVTPSCPVEHIDCAGENFPKVNEMISRGRNGQQLRTPVIGALVRLTERKVRLLRDKLSRTVIRFRKGDTGQKEEPGTGQNLGDLHVRPRAGFLITIPTEEELATRERNGLSARRYQQQEHDEPAARYMFAVLCADQTKGNRGDVYPEPLEVTALEWPDELTD